jgi:hypothetical protein
VRFIGYIPAVVRKMKVDRDAEVDITADVRRALHPRDPNGLRAGRHRRPLHVKPTPDGRRGKSWVQEEVLHPKGSLVFANSDDSWFVVEAPES